MGICSDLLSHSPFPVSLSDGLCPPIMASVLINSGYMRKGCPSQLLPYHSLIFWGFTCNEDQVSDGEEYLSLRESKSALINNIVTTHMMLVEECEKQIKISINLVSVRGMQKCLWPHNISCSLTIHW